MQKYVLASALLAGMAGAATASPTMETFGGFTVVATGSKIEVINDTVNPPAKVVSATMPIGSIQEITGAFPVIVARGANFFATVNFATTPPTVSAAIPLP